MFTFLTYKKNKLYLMIFFMLLISVSCSSKPTSSVNTIQNESMLLPQLTEYNADSSGNKEQIVISLENAYYHFTPDLYDFTIIFDIVADRDADFQDIKISFPTDVSYEITLEKQDVQKMNYDEYLSSIAFDWEEAGRLVRMINSVNNPETKEDFDAYYFQHKDAYESLRDHDRDRNFSLFTCVVRFDPTTLTESSTIDTLTIDYADRVNKFEIGEIMFDANPFLLVTPDDSPVKALRITASGKQALPNPDGSIFVSDSSFETKENIKLLSVEPLFPALQVEEVIIISNNEGVLSQKLYTAGDEFVVSAHAQFQPVIRFSYKSLKDDLLTNLNAAFVLTYEAINGEQYQALLSSSYRTKLSADELVLAQRESKKKHVFDYFYYFYNHIIGSNNFEPIV